MNQLQSKRIFGMTITQMVILGCLALMACGTVFGGLFFVSGSMGGSFSMLPSPVPTSTVQPTFTPYLTQTPTLTPTATDIPYEDLLPEGWDQYTTDSIELWVPPRFEVVDIEEERQKRIQFYEDLGYDDIAEELEDNPPTYVYWFKDSEPNTTLFIPNITIEPLLMTAENPDNFIDQENAKLPQEFIVVNRQDFQVGGYEARRLLLEANLNNAYIGVVNFVIFDGTNIWSINCGSHFTEFYTWLPEFDKMARTFRVINE